MNKSRTEAPYSALAARDPELPLPVTAGLTQLLRAYDYAEETGSAVWDFASEIEELRAAGLTAGELRWLVASGLVEHGEETSAYGAEHRAFRSSRGFTFVSGTAFVLTPTGAALARRLLADAESPPGTSDGAATLLRQAVAIRNSQITSHGSVPDGANALTRLPGSGAMVPSPILQPLPDGIKPVWDSRRRELCVGEYLVKRFRVPAENQELVLAAFQEENWPDVIDDPLPPTREIEPKKRLRDVITRLNGGQLVTLLRFHGNGSGEGVGWKLHAADRWKRESSASLRRKRRIELTTD